MPKTEEENIGTRSSHAESEPILLIQPFTVTPARTEQDPLGKTRFVSFFVSDEALHIEPGQTAKAIAMQTATAPEQSHETRDALEVEMKRNESGHGYDFSSASSEAAGEQTALVLNVTATWGRQPSGYMILPLLSQRKIKLSCQARLSY